jgi:hypothetical protein
MYNSGDPASVPEGRTTWMQNMIRRPGRWAKRDAFINTSVTGIAGSAIWEDTASGTFRLIAFKTDGASLDILRQTAGSSNFSDTTLSVNGTAVGAAVNYRGKLYFTLTDDTGTEGDPSGMVAYDGSAVQTNPLGGERIYARSLATFVDRIFLGGTTLAIDNKLGTTTAYDSTDWSTTTTTTTNITNGSSITSRITPTATTLSKIYKANKYTVAASTTDTGLVFRSDFRGTSPTYAMPLTTEIYYSEVWVTLTAYTAGAIRVPTTAGGNGFRYRATVAGTSAAGEPVWPTTVGTTVADGTVTWICDGRDAIASQPVTVPPMTDDQAWTSSWCRAVVPPMPASANVGVRIKFGTDAISAIELAPIDISLKDGVTDGEVRKGNRGQQLTEGKFAYPFFNQESTATATVERGSDIYWTETSDPNTVEGDNFFHLRDLPGRITAMAVVGGRLIVFKERGMWVFQGTADPENPIVRESFFSDAGCVFHDAVTVFEDRLYFIANNEVYSYEPGGTPRPLCGDAMREDVPPNTSVMARWPSVAVHHDDRTLILVSLNSFNGAHFYVMDIDSGEWGLWRTDITADAECGLLRWIPGEDGRLFLGIDVTAGTLDLHRLGVNSGDGAANADVLSSILLRPICSYFPDREMSLDAVAVHAIATSTNLRVNIGNNGGVTFPKDNTVTLPSSTSVYARTVIPTRQTGSRLAIYLDNDDTAGEQILSISRVDVIVRDLGPARVTSTPTQVLANL